MVRSVKMTWFQKSKKDPTPKLPKVFRKTRYCTCTEFLGYSYIYWVACQQSQRRLSNAA